MCWQWRNWAFSYRISFIPWTTLEFAFALSRQPSWRWHLGSPQRYFLKVLGLIDFLEIYEPCMQGWAPHATSAADCHGAFTNNPQFAQQLFDASLSLYLIRTHKLVKANNPKLLDFVLYFMPTNLVHAEADPPFPTIFEGSTMDHKKHASIHNYFRTWLVYGNSFGNKENTLDCHVISKPDVYAASMTTPMSELLWPQPPVRSSSSRSLTTASSSRPSLSKGSWSLTTTSLSSQSQAALSSHSKAWASSKSTILSFFPNTYPGQQCQSHIRNKARCPGGSGGRNKFHDPDSFYVPPLSGKCGLMPLQQSIHCPNALLNKTKPVRTSGIMPFQTLHCLSCQVMTRRNWCTFWHGCAPVLPCCTAFRCRTRQHSPIKLGATFSRWATVISCGVTLLQQHIKKKFGKSWEEFWKLLVCQRHPPMQIWIQFIGETKNCLLTSYPGFLCFGKFCGSCMSWTFTSNLLVWINVQTGTLLKKIQ